MTKRQSQPRESEVVNYIASDFYNAEYRRQYEALTQRGCCHEEAVWHANHRAYWTLQEWLLNISKT